MAPIDVGPAVFVEVVEEDLGDDLGRGNGACECDAAGQGGGNRRDDAGDNEGTKANGEVFECQKIEERDGLNLA